MAKWVAHNRRFAKEGKLSSARKARLITLGLELDPMGTAWETMFSELKRFKARFGHCNVPEGWVESPQLARWVMQQRQRNKDGMPSAGSRLDELGIDWVVRDFAWERMFGALKDYRDEHGDCNVPRGWTENPKLATWVKRQRDRRGKLSLDRKARLDELGFEWSRKRGR